MDLDETALRIAAVRDGKITQKLGLRQFLDCERVLNSLPPSTSLWACEFLRWCRGKQFKSITTFVAGGSGNHGRPIRALDHTKRYHLWHASSRPSVDSRRRNFTSTEF